MAHIFDYDRFHVLSFVSRYTTNVIVTETGEVSQGTCPVQILFSLKEQNKKKLNRYVDLHFVFLLCKISNPFPFLLVAE